MIILKRLKWSNCFSYGDLNEIDLNETSLTQIVGTNGAGKSSIPLIVEEVLYNKNSKGTKKSEIANRYLGDSYSIELEFQVNEDEYVVELKRTKSLKVKLAKNGEDISSHTATNTFQTLEDLIGVDFKTFSQLVYQNTSSSLAFLTATDTERKKFLIDLLNLDKYLEYFETFKEYSKQLTLKKTALDSRITTLNKWISENNIEGMIVLPPIKFEIGMEEEEKEWARLTAEIKNISEKNKIIEKNNFYKNQLKLIDLTSYANVTGEKQVYDAETKEVGELTATREAAIKSLDKLMKLKDQCPTCLQSIKTDFKESLVDEYTLTETDCNIRIKELNTIIKNKKALNKQLEEKAKAEQEFQSLYRSIDKSLPNTFVDKDDLSTRLQIVTKVLEDKRTKIQEYTRENLLRERNNTKISLIEEQSENIKVQLNEASKEIDELIETLNLVEILKKAFSTNGLLAYKIENLVKELEDLANEYLIELSDGRFALLFAAEKDKLNVHISDNGNIIDISALSSGELARVNTATLLAIRKLMNSLSKTQLNVLFLDEVINVLDENGRERLVDVLLREENLNTFVISHGWTHALLNKLYIIKEDKISRVE